MTTKNLIPVTVLLPNELMEKIEKDRGDVPKAKFLMRIIEKHYVEKKKR